jgi:hypothetical protein
MPLPSAATNSVGVGTSRGLDSQEQAINDGGLTVFQNFVEEIVAASLTSTMEAGETPAAILRIRGRSRHSQVENVSMKNSPPPPLKTAKPKKVSFTAFWDSNALVRVLLFAVVFR